jgi:hypothetical protein
LVSYTRALAGVGAGVGSGIGTGPRVAGGNDSFFYYAKVWLTADTSLFASVIFSDLVFKDFKAFTMTFY